MPRFGHATIAAAAPGALYGTGTDFGDGDGSDFGDGDGAGAAGAGACLGTLGCLEDAAHPLHGRGAGNCCDVTSSATILFFFLAAATIIATTTATTAAPPHECHQGWTTDEVVVYKIVYYF
jgi:hypothetical protein